MIELQASKDRMKARNIPNQILPPEEIAFRGELTTKIRTLNDTRTKQQKLI